MGGPDETMPSIPRTGNAKGKGTGATVSTAEPIPKPLNDQKTRRRSFVSPSMSTDEAHSKVWARREPVLAIGADLQRAPA
jgi:hypothetical protein